MDLIQMGFDYLIKSNGSAHRVEDGVNFANFTLIDEVARADIDYEYGNYVRHSEHVYYQVLLDFAYKCIKSFLGHPSTRFQDRP